MPSDPQRRPPPRRERPPPKPKPDDWRDHLRFDDEPSGSFRIPRV